MRLVLLRNKWKIFSDYYIFIRNIEVLAILYNRIHTTLLLNVILYLVTEMIVVCFCSY